MSRRLVPWSGVVPGALFAALALTLAAGCAGAASGSQVPERSERYPEKKRPEPLRSASDGEIMGADNQTPEDRLEASPTNEHPAAGWAVEDGKLVPHRERRAGAPAPAAAPAEPSPAEEECPPESASAESETGAAAGASGVKKKRKCRPRAPE